MQSVELCCACSRRLNGLGVAISCIYQVLKFTVERPTKWIIDNPWKAANRIFVDHNGNTSSMHIGDVGLDVGVVAGCIEAEYGRESRIRKCEPVKVHGWSHKLALTANLTDLSR